MSSPRNGPVALPLPIAPIALLMLGVALLHLAMTALAR